MFGQLLATCHWAVAEAGCIVVGHGAKVIGLVLVNEPHSCYRIAGFIEFPEYEHQVVCDETVAHHLAHMPVPVKVVMRQLQEAQFRSRHTTSPRI